MDLLVRKSGIFKPLLILFLSLFAVVSLADDDITSVSAGDDQVVAAGDLVSLAGVITFEDDKHGKEHGHEYRKYAKKHHGHENRHGHKVRHKRDDRDDEKEFLIAWSQSAGTAVEMTDDNTLTPSFVAPQPAGVSETLSFVLSVYDDDGELIASDSVNVEVHAPLSTLNGRITAVDGSELANVSVNVLSNGNVDATVVSDANGGFSLQYGAGSEAVLYLTADGYADQVVPVKMPAADLSLSLDISMIARGAVQSFDAGASTTLQGDDGASVSVTAGSFVDANGQAVTGAIDLTITPVDVSNPATLAAFPGEFSGVLEGDTTDTPIISMGSVEFEFSQNGQSLQLAAGATAEVQIPIYISTYQDGSPIAVGDSIPLWSLDEASGIWQQEGFGTVVSSADSPSGLAMLASVSHFSWWNCDVSMNAAQAIVTVTGPDTGTALIKARTHADIGYRPNTVDTVASIGVATSPLYIPSNGEVCFWADVTLDNGYTGTTPEVCVNAAPSSLINIDLVTPVAGPVSIQSHPAEVAGVVDVTGYLNYPIQRVQLLPSTYETAVSYSIISGTLPVGLSLNPVSATRAEIAGVATEAGSFSVVVEATDSDGYTDTITINYTVTTDVPPPDLSMFINVTYVAVPVTFDMNSFNNGGPATTWSLSYNPLLEQVPPPPGLSLDPATGILTISDYCIFWDGTLIATNGSGTSEAQIYIQDGTCF